MPSLLLAALATLSQVAPAASPRPIREEFRAILSEEGAALKALADRLSSAGKRADSEAVARAIEPAEIPGSLVFRPLPEWVPAAGSGLANVPVAKADAIPAEALESRDESAEKLFDLAGRAGGPKFRRLALADEALRAVLGRKPNHTEARRLLGFVSYKGGWATPHAVALLDRGCVLHPSYGWVKRDWVEHLDRGELPADGSGDGSPKRWIPAEQADALRTDWSRSWHIRTAPHFEIQANVPLAEAVAFGRRLEAFQELFFSQFADVVGADPKNLPLARRFDNPKEKPSTSAKKFAVAYFASKADYVDFLRKRFRMNEEISLGYYMPPSEARGLKATPRSYFYRDAENPIEAHATLYHEASHQLLFESAGTALHERNPGDYWVWEGLGTYFETVEVREDGSLLVGGLVGPRIELARQKSRAGEFLPLAKFTALGRREFGEDAGEAVYRNYAEAMALAIFLLHGEGGRYREPYLEYVADAYRGRLAGRTLADRLGVPFAKLDEELAAFLK